MKKKRPELSQNKIQNSRTAFCWAYPSDLEQFYAFYCARYENISYDKFLNLGLSEAMMKLNSLPESEPLYKTIKSRTINLYKIKNKEERIYWREQNKINKIPSIYLSSKELDNIFKEEIENGKKGFSRI